MTLISIKSVNLYIINEKINAKNKINMISNIILLIFYFWIFFYFIKNTSKFLKNIFKKQILKKIAKSYYNCYKNY